MTKAFFFSLFLFLGPFNLYAQSVLIVADEFPAMEVLARRLKQEENIASKIISQTNLPQDLGQYRAVVVYIHRGLNSPAEAAFIQYTKNGGRLLVLHHSISSGKRQNKQWFPFLGVDLPTGPVEQGGYKWVEPVTVQWVNIARQHFITSHKIEYPESIDYQPDPSSQTEQKIPGFTLNHSEAYINHLLTEPRQLLLGIKYNDEKTAKTYMQDRAGWVRKQGKGLIVYLMPGHSVSDFENPVFGRMAINSIIYSQQ